MRGKKWCLSCGVDLEDSGAGAEADEIRKKAHEAFLRCAGEASRRVGRVRRLFYGRNESSLVKIQPRG